MNKERIKINGRDEDKKAIKEILEHISSDLPDTEETIEVFTDSAGDFSHSSVVIARIGDKSRFTEARRLITYSEGFSDADVVSLNPQKREQSSSFEVMTNGFMGRAFMRNDSKYSAFQLLMAFSVTYAMGVGAEKALKILNDYTMKRNEE